MKLLLRVAVLVALAGSLSAQNVVIKPYVQPTESVATSEKDAKLITWVTDQKPGEFTVQFGATPSLGSSVRPERVTLNISTNHRYFKYIATLADLPLDATIHYRVQLAGKTVRESSFATRKGAASPLRFVVVGDTADGKAGSRKIAFQMDRAKPDFMLIVGDIVYSRGRVSEYFSNFWGMYANTPRSSPSNGAPFMQSVPVHAVLGNHDVGASNLTSVPDGFGAFYFFHAPTNGPRLPEIASPVNGSKEKLAAFKAGAGAAHQALPCYSFDNGPAHFLCLDGNRMFTVTNVALRQWIEQDLTGSKAAWKFVFFHQPGFHSSVNHYNEQKMRLLSPLFEKCGVDIVFAGHVHNYQRSKPFKFAPANPDRPDAKGIVAGRFTLDEKFDGKQITQPQGVLYIVSGGGGAGLYNSEFTGYPETWVRTNAWAPFTVKFIADRHSFSLVELNAQQMTLRQLDDDGDEVDRFQITKHK